MSKILLEVFDDSDPSIVLENPRNEHWNNNVIGNPSEYNRTTTLTRIQGARAWFNFFGSSVAVYGTIPVPEREDGSTHAESLYSVDGGPPVIYQYHEHNTENLYRQQFFKSDILEEGNHSLVITNNIKGPYFWLDYIEFHSTLAPPVIKPTTGPDGCQPIYQEKPVTDHNSIAIIAGTLGAVVLMSMILNLMMFVHQHRHRMSEPPKARQPQWNGSSEASPEGSSEDHSTLDGSTAASQTSRYIDEKKIMRNLQFERTFSESDQVDKSSDTMAQII
ncbi:unnamed protein product [Cyclocybe aegerita]|uniref:Uncharacterized protein n=1 Tax=Cyclocybe aegerita TaxID=1973307 RepID=A0A8S0XN19_CYCAE|nr:unnamed protein product [Cyclocybe aegerita]